MKRLHLEVRRLSSYRWKEGILPDDFDLDLQLRVGDPKDRCGFSVCWLQIRHLPNPRSEQGFRVRVKIKRRIMSPSPMKIGRPVSWKRPKGVEVVNPDHYLVRTPYTWVIAMKHHPRVWYRRFNMD